MAISLNANAKNVVWFNGGHVTYSVQKTIGTVVEKATTMMESDLRAITGRSVQRKSDNGTIQIYQLDKIQDKELELLSKLRVPYLKFIVKKDAYWIGMRNRRIYVVGSNGRGTAYGLMELTRRCGVSPWVWWGDVTPTRRSQLQWDDSKEIMEWPSVEYRGIYLDNPEWTNSVWDRNTLDRKMKAGTLGPHYYHRLFELMIRLKANTLWTTMHKDRNLFAANAENSAVADSFDIVIGSAHDEPLHHHKVSSHNKKKKHKKDEGMIDDVPQVFVMDGLDPSQRDLHFDKNITLLWSDDNYGYLTRLPDASQQQRNEGNGLFYHLSYAGIPHDYLWLSTTQPGLVASELQRAWDHQVRKLWIVGVHDPKVAAYDLSLFMDKAWRVGSVGTTNVSAHLQRWLTELFGDLVAQRIINPMREFYRLTAIRRPEFMGWNQISTDGKTEQRQPVQNTDFNADEFGNELEHYLACYQKVRKAVELAASDVAPDKTDAYFATVVYPVQAAACMAIKMLEAQESRHIGRIESFHHDDEALESASLSWKAYNELRQLTLFYNDNMAGGKWKGNMNCAPRDLPVFGAPVLTDVVTAEEMRKYDPGEVDWASRVTTEGCVVKAAADFDSSTGAQTLDLLGHSLKAVQMDAEGTLRYRFWSENGEYALRLAFIPVHPDDNGDLRVEVRIDDGTPQVFSLKEEGRTEQWCENVLRQQALRTMNVQLSQGSHTLTVRALDNGVTFDQWMLDPDKEREFYMFPTP
ncbi:MAG: glycosyl hydrolase 115 family protein [Prevotella sp.]